MTENAIRKKWKRAGYLVKKNRQNGLFMLVDPSSNCVVAGSDGWSAIWNLQDLINAYKGEV